MSEAYQCALALGRERDFNFRRARGDRMPRHVPAEREDDLLIGLHFDEFSGAWIDSPTEDSKLAVGDGSERTSSHPLNEFLGIHEVRKNRGG